MYPVYRIASGISLVALVSAGAFLFWVNQAGVQRVNYVTDWRSRPGG